MSLKGPFLSYCLYRFITHLSYRFHRASIYQNFFLVQNDMGHLSTSAEVCCPLVHFVCQHTTSKTTICFYLV